MAEEVRVSIVLEGEEEYNQKIESINRACRLWESNLQKVKSAQGGQAESVESLNERLEALRQIQEKLNEKLEAANKVLESAKSRQEAYTEEVSRVRENLQRAEESQRALGEQTEETGFKMANGILDGQIVQVYGGGICQVSSTIFAAALYANLEIVERWNHDFVSSYIPAGVDAAVAWAALDFQYANNTSYPLKMEVSYMNGNLTVDLWGTKTDDSIVELATEIVSDVPGSNLELDTYRYVYNGDRSQAFIEKVAHSSYLR